MRRAHDMGGLPGGPVTPEEHDYALWEKRVDAMSVLIGNKNIFNLDEFRHAIELLGADAHEKLSYYERWVYAIAHNLVQRGVITVDELGRRMAEVEKAGRT